MANTTEIILNAVTWSDLIQLGILIVQIVTLIVLINNSTNNKKK